MNKKIITIVGVIILVVAAFYGGMVYGKSSNPASAQGFRMGNFAGNPAGNPAGARGGNRAGGAGGFSGGQILSTDPTGITVKLQNGNSQIILISGSTPVLKTVAGTLSDLKVGEQVTVTGTTNSDGSITASSVQVRPATTTPVQ